MQVHNLRMRAASALFIVALTIASAQGQVQKPSLGSPLRKAVLDGLRPAIEKDLKQKVIFKVEDLRVYQGWAYVSAHSLQPNGKSIDFTKTRYRAALDDGAFDGDSTYALMKLQKGAWQVQTFAIGPTDVVWINWMEAPHRAPKTLFPPPYGPK
jgi:hypothetical protein